jgi:hypothetical protein
MPLRHGGDRPLHLAHAVPGRMEQGLHAEAEYLTGTIHMKPEDEAQQRGVLVL